MPWGPASAMAAARSHRRGAGAGGPRCTGRHLDESRTLGQRSQRDVKVQEPKGKKSEKMRSDSRHVELEAGELVR